MLRRYNMNNLELDTIIKAYDFEPMPERDDCYIIGNIKEVRFNSYVIEVLEDSWDGTGRVGQEIIVPKPEYMMHDFEGRISVMNEETLH